jgi:hypothetical protein
MTKELETAPEPGSDRPAPQPAAPRKPYASPRLQEWGSVTELTRGTGAGFSDAGFQGGSGGF